MKFGKRLLRQAHTEWSSFYIDYASLKYELKQAVTFGDLQGLVWSNMLQNELHKVNDFYLEKENQLAQQLQTLEATSVKDGAFQESFTKYCRFLELLRYYVVLNYIAAYKIIKKRNKLLKTVKTIDYLAVLMEQPFYTSVKLAQITVKTELLGLKVIPGQNVNENSFTCSICLDVLCNPVVLSCTHRFCWACLSETSERMQACPVCRKDQKLDPLSLTIDWILKEFLHQQFPESQENVQTVSKDGLIQQLEKRVDNIPPLTSNGIGTAELLKPQPAPTSSPCNEPNVQECKYALVKRIGEGVFGEVYLAHKKDDPAGPQYALKKLSKRHPKFKRAAVMREITAGKALQHEGIIGFIESFETVSSIYLVMEYFPGQDLFSQLEDRSCTPFPEEEAKNIFQQLIAGLAHCHQRGIAHRDIKLENILIDKQGKTRLIDFGLCDSVLDIHNRPRMCLDSVGSPAYISPEILMGKPYNGFKADVWSSGVVLYALLFGCFPFSSNQYKQLVKGTPVEVHFPDSTVSSVAQDLIHLMLTLDPQTRISLQEVQRHDWMVI
jgi:5'-AMP-activated protein kinase catalytic alpha subunit